MRETPGASRFILRLGLLVLASWLLWVGFRIVPAATTRVIWLPVVVGVYLTALASGLGAATLRQEHERVARIWMLIAVLAGVVIWFAVEVTVYYPRYRADTMVLSHIAAEETLRGRNPYTVETAAVIEDVQRLGFPPSLITHTTDGKPIARLVAYPALHFLIFVPALAVGISDLRWVILAFELLALAMLWRWSPRRFQPLVFVPFLVNPDLLVTFTSGLTDWLWVTPLMIAAVALLRGRIALAGVAYGCAAAVKPLPWIALPFLVIWLLKSRPKGAASPAGMFLGPALIAFFAANAPFIALDPAAWAGAVTTPFVAPLVLDGHGLSILSKVGWLPDSRLLYAGLTAGTFVTAVVAYWRYFHRLEDTLWILPAVVMWVAYRSFHNYILYWLPPAYLWVMLNVSPQPTRDHASPVVATRPSRHLTRLRLEFLGVVLLIVAVLTAAIGTVRSSSNPIGVKVIAVSARSVPHIIDGMTVEVTNRTPAPIELVFTVIRAGRSVIWQVETGPHTVAPGATALYGIVAPPGGGTSPRNLYAGEGPEGEPALLRVTAKGTDAAASVWIPGP